MTASIPASRLAQVIPGVLSAGGNPLALNSVYITSDPSIPYGTAQAFASAADVSDWFGPSAPETILANVYFAGFTNCTVLPGTLWFAQFNTADIPAYLRGGSVAALTLTGLQALSGTITVTIDGQINVSAAINLSGAVSFTNAASLIQAGLQSSTAVFNGTASQAAGVVTIASTITGSLAIGDVLNGSGVDGPATIISFGTYTVLAGTGTVNVSTSATVSLGSATVAGTALVTYDTLRKAFVVTSSATGVNSTIGFGDNGALSQGLNLTAALGAVTSQGAAANTPAGVMAQIVAATQNWATFMTVTEQTLSVKEAFAAWVQTTNQRYLYVCQDSDVTPTTSPNATGSFGNIVNANEDTGVMPVYDTSGTGVIAAFQTAIAASINFNQQNGRTTAAFRWARRPRGASHERNRLRQSRRQRIQLLRRVCDRKSAVHAESARADFGRVQMVRYLHRSNFPKQPISVGAHESIGERAGSAVRDPRLQPDSFRAARPHPRRA